MLRMQPVLMALSSGRRIQNWILIIRKGDLSAVTISFSITVIVEDHCLT